MGVIAETTGAANYRDHGQRRRYGDDATDDAWFFLRYSLSVFGYMYTSRRGHGSKKKVTCIILVTGPFLGKPVGGHLTTIGCFIAQSYLDIFAKQILETEIAFARSHLKLNQTDVALGRKQVQITCLSRFEPL